MKKRVVILVFFTSLNLLSQNRDLASISYTGSPLKGDDLNYSNLGGFFSFPLKFKVFVILNNLSYRQHSFNYLQSPSFLTDDIEDFYEISHRAVLVRKISDDWRLTINMTTVMASNLMGSLSSEDFNFNGGVLFMKDWEKQDKKSMLSLGVFYTNSLGRPRFLPSISYQKTIEAHSSFSIGFPNFYYERILSPKNSLKALLWVSGFFANASNEVPITSELSAQKVSFFTGSLGLEYTHRMDPSLSIFFKGGYSIINQYQLLDEESNEVYDFNLDPAIYISTGLRYNINFKKSK